MRLAVINGTASESIFICWILMYGAIQFASLPVKPPRAVHFTVIESPRTLLTPEKSIRTKKKGSAQVHTHTCARAFLPMTVAIVKDNSKQMRFTIVTRYCARAHSPRQMLRRPRVKLSGSGINFVTRYTPAHRTFIEVCNGVCVCPRARLCRWKLIKQLGRRKIPRINYAAARRRFATMINSR